jgi:RNA polymerase sigma factor (sigma-70 family)
MGAGSEPVSFCATDPEQLARLADAVAKLPRRERGVFEAVAVEGLTQAEAAERLGIGRARVERLLAHALRRLDRRLNG